MYKTLPNSGDISSPLSVVLDICNRSRGQYFQDFLSNMKESFKFPKLSSCHAKNSVLQLFTFLLAITILFIFPLLLIVNVPFYILRYFILKSAKYVRPDLGKMVTTRAQVFASDDLYNRPKSNIIVSVTVQGNVDMDKATENASRTLLTAQLPNGEIKYPELKQYITNWAGYYFWKDDTSFNVQKHVILHKKCKSITDRFTDQDVQHIRQELVEMPWLKKSPLWSVTFIPNCYPTGVEDPGPHTTVILKFHHSLGDGYSWLYLLIEGLCEKPITTPLPNYFKRDPFSTLVFALSFPLRAAYTFAELVVLSYAKPPWRVSNNKQTGKFNINLTNRIPLNKLKEIKSHYKVSFSTVVFAVMAGAMRDIMMQKGMHIPKTIPTLTTLPIPGHSVKLRNYMTGAIARLPIGEPDPLERLKFSSKDYIRIKRSAAPMLLKYMFMIVGSHFSCVTKVIGKNFSLSTGISNFPGGFEYMSYNGHKCVDAMFSVGLQSGCGGLGFCALSYVDGIRISPTADVAVMSKVEVEDLTHLIEKHVDILYHLAITGV